MKLYHFSNQKFTDVLKVKYFGENAHICNDNNVCNIKRLYFYTKDKPAEAIFNYSKYCYIVNISKCKIYNLDKDVFKLKERYSGNISLIIRNIIRNGYYGIIYTIGYKVIAVFKNVKIDKITTRGGK